MLNEEDLDLAAGFALGTLNGAERAEIQRRLSEGNAELAAAVQEIRDASALLTHGTATSQPPVGLRQRVLGAARGEMGVSAPGTTPSSAMPRPAAPRPPRPAAAGAPAPGLLYAAGAAALVFAILGAILFAQNQRLRSRADGLETQLHKMEADLVQMSETNRWGEVWQSPFVRVATFGPTGQAQTPITGRVAYDPRTQRAVIRIFHARVPDGRDLELWAIRSGNPWTLGVFQPDANGEAEIRIPTAGNVSELTGFSISLESKGGSGDPNAMAGPVLVAARLPG